MILQKDSRLNEEINKWGCYLMSLLWFGNKLQNWPFDTDGINELYTLFIKYRWMKADCYILMPDKILQFLGIDIIGVKREAPEYNCKKNEIEIMKWKKGTIPHFVAGDGRGNVTYDPWGCSRTVRKGALYSKRIFSLGG